ncbi:hypothetical protein AAEX28_01885 [Lentisphaerota bacterium WC36G]|nr:hypothetical protein LJT99_04770 [Lentisphaerae bacterium WC36]
MNKQNIGARIESDFAEFLIENGYPKETLLLEPRIGDLKEGYYHPDFIILDPYCNEKLAIIEVKAKLFLNKKKQIKNQLDQYRKAVGDPLLPIFLVTPNDDSDAQYSFNLYTFDDNNDLTELDFKLFPKFKTLSSNKISYKRQSLYAKKEKSYNSFKILAFIIAGVLFLCVMADFICSRYNITLLTAERLTLLGAAAALTIIPYAQKFKGLGIEWERTQDKSKNEK